MSSDRIAALSEHDLLNKYDSKDSDNTKNATKCAVKIFRSHIAATVMSPYFESYTQSELCKTLGRLV
jgi:hypothetical protein